MKSQEIQSLLAVGPEALSTQQRGSYTGLLFCRGKTSSWRAHHTPYHFRWEAVWRLVLDWGGGESVFIWEEPGVSLIYRGAWETVVTIARKSQEVGGGSLFFLSPPSLVPILLCLPPESPFSLPWLWHLRPPYLWEYLVLFQLQLHLFTCSFSLCSCSQLEGGSGTWAGSSLRRTLSFILGMTGKAKVGPQGGREAWAPLPSPVPFLSTSPSAPRPSFPQ